MLKIALLDDYVNVAPRVVDWHQLGAVSVEVVNTSLMEDAAARIEALRPFDIIVAMRERTPLTADMIQDLDQLKLIVTTGMRNNSIDGVAARKAGVDLCGTQMIPYAAFEHAWALLMALAKQIPAEHMAMRDGAWQQHTGIGLNGRALGILGLGKLGSQMARAAAAFNMSVIAWSPNLTAERAEAQGARLVSKEALFETSDFLSIHLVLSDTTRNLIDAAAFARMKPSAYLINTSRGPIVNEAALIDALKAGQIKGAGLDVYDQEPLPVDHPLRTAPNVVLTGHTGYVIEEMHKTAYGQALENIFAWQEGAPIRVLNADA